MANLKSTGAELLRSGEYSDFTLVCKGQEFRVHKSIICPQSSVIAAALKSEFKEAKTNTIEVNFEPAILKCMLDYMYTGNYEDPAKPVQPLQDAQPFQPSQTAQTAQPISRGSPAKLSATKIGELLYKRWSADAFCDLVRESKGSTGDKNLQEVLTRSAVSHMFELMSKNLFSKGKIANDMAAGVLEASFKIFKDKNTEVTKLKTQLLNEAVKVERLEGNLKELADVLLAARSCYTFYNLIKEATGDKNLRKVIVHAAAEHVSELVSKGEISNDIANEVLEISIKDSVKKPILRKKSWKERIETLEKNLKEIAEDLLKRRKCAV
ncbi:hypothetical protein F4679DRAFT_579577 [Xylaria curta]|nr:hypothetical protein F4679DRAFT_579577 [Xylaria curta]